MEKRNKIFMAIGSAAIIATIGLSTSSIILRATDQNKVTNPAVTSTSNSQTTNSNTSINNSQTTNSNTMTNSYKSGDYSAKISYNVPHGSNTLNLNVTILDNKITAVSTDNGYSDNESGMYISSFESSLDKSAVGTDISSYLPSRIGGASLTTNAFNQALTLVKNDAKV